MNENSFASQFDSSDDEVLARAIDRYADGECSAEEEAELFACLDATPGAWKQCALALVDARDFRAALSGAGGSRIHEESRQVLDRKIVLASSLDTGDDAPEPRQRHFLSWSAVLVGLLVAFAAGLAVAPRGAADAPSLAKGQDSTRSVANPPAQIEMNEDPRLQRNDGELIASAGRPEAPSTPASGPEIVNVVYRPSGDGEESSAPLPVYKSDDDWARALNQVVRQSDADLAERRAQLLSQGVDLERRIVLQPVKTEQGEMLLPVETFQIVPVSLSSFH